MTPRKQHGRSGAGRRREATGSAGRGPEWSGWHWVIPGLVALVLAAPRLDLGYFWDDYSFINFKGTGDPAYYLRPDPTFTFYRPIPQGLYALFLRWVDPQSGVVGHWINLALLVASVVLFARLATALAGRWAGFLAGLCLASLGVLPSLVAWVSCSHDLFAMFFLLIALQLRHANRFGPSMVAAACALLSKESALGFFPALVFWDRLVGRSPAPVVRPLVSYGALTVIWMAIHPGMRTLIGRGFQAGATGYVGLAYPERQTLHVLQYLVTLANVPLTGVATVWPADLGSFAVAALAVAAIGFGLVRRSLSRSAESTVPIPSRNLALISGLLLVPPILLPALFVRHWAPYFAFGAALGTSLFLGAFLSRLRAWVTLPAIGAYLLLGVWCRGLFIPNEKVWSEPVLVDASQSIARVKRNFLGLVPSLPKGAQLLLSVGASGSRGIASTLLDGQALSLWYGDPTLRSTTAEQRQRGFPVDLLFRITSDLDVALIDPVNCRYHATTERMDASETSRPVRTYARAVAASGEPDLAIQVLTRLADLEGGDFRSMDLRLAASVARAAGRQQEAEALRAKAEPLSHDAAVQLLARVFGNPTRDAALDSCAYWAFEVSPDDPETIRYYLQIFITLGNPLQIEHFAKRLEVLVPGNPESREALRRISAP